MATTKPIFIRPRVDWFEGGRVLYKAGNTYPADEALTRMQALGQADLVPAKASRTRAESAAPGPQADAQPALLPGGAPDGESPAADSASTDDTAAE